MVAISVVTSPLMSLSGTCRPLEKKKFSIFSIFNSSHLSVPEPFSDLILDRMRGVLNR